MSEEVKNMFASISAKYDLANDVLSLGIHRLWRKRACKLLGKIQGATLLDVATGTGDFACVLKNAVGPEGAVTGVDFVPEMIELAKGKYSSKDIDFQVADAMSLPFEDESFDVVTISFGIRNVDDTSLALKEFLRVLKPSGRICVLEFGTPYLIGLKQLFIFYSKYLMPFIGGLVSGNRDAYEYLPETSANYPCRDEFIELLKEAGFKDNKWTGLMGGIAYIYLGNK